MRFYVFAATALAAVTIAAGQTIDNIAMQDFLNKFKTSVAPTTLPTPQSKNLVPSGPVSPVSDCTTDTGKEGFCVRKAACQDGNAQTSGINIIKIRSMTQCPDTDVCCEFKRQTTTPDDTDVPLTPVGSNVPWSPVGSAVPSTPVGPSVPGWPGPGVPTTPAGFGVPSAPVGQGVPPTPFKPGAPWTPPTTPPPAPVNFKPPFLPPTIPGTFPGTQQQPAVTTTKQGCGWRNENGVADVPATAPAGSAKPGEFPWLVTIIRKDGYQVGGGFLIHEKVALTAAHKIALEGNPALLYVDVGNYDGAMMTLPRMRKRVLSFVLHDQYQGGVFINDIAMVIIKKPVQWLPNMGYICLPPLNAPVTPGSRCFASGWGKNSNDVYASVMGKVEIPAMSRDACETSLRTTDLGRFFVLDKSFMCAGGELGKDTCIGDGGSPLACPIEGQPGRYMASGVLSWAMSCGLDGLPSVFVDVASSRQWIDDQMKLYGFSTDTYTA